MGICKKEGWLGKITYSGISESKWNLSHQPEDLGKNPEHVLYRKHNENNQGSVWLECKCGPHTGIYLELMEPKAQNPGIPLQKD